MSGLAGCGLFRATMRAVEFCTTTRAPRGTAQLSIFRRVDVRVVACAKAGPENRTRRRGMSLMTRDIPDPIHATTNPFESCAPDILRCSPTAAGSCTCTGKPDYPSFQLWATSDSEAGMPGPAFIQRGVSDSVIANA